MQRVRLDVEEYKEQPIFRDEQQTAPVDYKPFAGTLFPVQATWPYVPKYSLKAEELESEIRLV